MKVIQEVLNRVGYSQEEAYFHEQNKLLIEEFRKRRARLFELGKKLESAPPASDALRKRDRAAA